MKSYFRRQFIGNTTFIANTDEITFPYCFNGRNSNRCIADSYLIASDSTDVFIITQTQKEIVDALRKIYQTIGIPSATYIIGVEEGKGTLTEALSEQPNLIDNYLAHTGKRYNENSTVIPAVCSRSFSDWMRTLSKKNSTPYILNNNSKFAVFADRIQEFKHWEVTKIDESLPYLLLANGNDCGSVVVSINRKVSSMPTMQAFSSIEYGRAYKNAPEFINTEIQAECQTVIDFLQQFQFSGYVTIDFVTTADNKRKVKNITPHWTPLSAAAVLATKLPQHIAQKPWIIDMTRGTHFNTSNILARELKYGQLWNKKLQEGVIPLSIVGTRYQRGIFVTIASQNRINQVRRDFVARFGT